MAAESPHLRVLIAYGKKSGRARLTRLMKVLGYEVVEVETGQQALDGYGIHQPDIVLLGNGLAELGEFEVAHAIKQQAGKNWAPVLFISPFDEVDSKIEAKDLGDGWIRWPIDPKAAEGRLRFLEKVLELHRHTEAERAAAARMAQTMADEQQLAAHIIERICARTDTLGDLVQTVIKPSSLVSGDAIVTEQGPDGRFFLLLADATGHGLPAAVSLLSAVQCFHTMAHKGFAPGDIAVEMSAKTRELLPENRFIAALIVELDYPNQRLHVWNGAMPEAFVLGRDGTVRQRFASKHLPLGLLAFEDGPRAIEEMILQPGDRLLACSDGVSECLDEPFSTHIQRLWARVGSAGLHLEIERLVREGHSHDDASVASLAVPR